MLGRLSVGKIRALSEALEAVNRSFALMDTMSVIGAPDLVDAMTALAREIRDYVDKSGEMLRIQEELRMLKDNAHPSYRVEESV